MPSSCEKYQSVNAGQTATIVRRIGSQKIRMTADGVFLLANWIGVAALGIGVMCACAIAVSGKIRDDALKLALAEQQTKTKDAELKLAELRKLAGPRDINLATFKKELEGKPKAPVAIWYVPEVSDGYWFATRLSSALQMAGWEVSWPQNIPELTREDVEKVMSDSSGRIFSLLRAQPPAMTAGAQPNGVTIVGDGDLSALKPDAAMSPLKALFQALSKSTGFGMYGSGGSQFMPVPKGTLRVVIAAKADPLFIDKPIATNSDK